MLAHTNGADEGKKIKVRYNSPFLYPPVCSLVLCWSESLMGRPGTRSSEGVKGRSLGLSPAHQTFFPMIPVLTDGQTSRAINTGINLASSLI